MPPASRGRSADSLWMNLTDETRMHKIRFDDTDYSIVVKNKGVPPKSVEVGGLSSREIDRDRAAADLFSHHDGR